MSNRKVIISTDIGSDVDDSLSLQCFSLSPTISIFSVIVTHGVLETRAKLAVKMLQNLGDNAVVALGAESHIGDVDPSFATPFITGFESVALTREERERPFPNPIDGIDLLIDQIRSDSPILVSIAPMSTLALALEKDPRIVNLIPHLYILGGMIDGAEHNFVHDPIAARIVLASGIPTTVIPVDILERVSHGELTELNGSPNQKMIARMAKAWKLYHELRAIQATYNQELQELSRAFDDKLCVVPAHQNPLPRWLEEIRRILEEYPKALERPNLPEEARELFTGLIDLAQLFVSLRFLLNEQNWLDDFEGCEASFALVLASKGLYHQLFRSGYLGIEYSELGVYDAYVPYLMENPDHCEIRSANLSVGPGGEMGIRKGSSHTLVTSIDHEHFRQFLRTRLKADSKKRPVRRLLRRLIRR